MSNRVVTTTEVGSWMQDLGDHFASILEDRSSTRVRPPAVDENGASWTYERIEDVTGISVSTLKRMVRKSRSGSPRVRAGRSTNDLTRDVRRAARHEPQSVVDGILDAPEERREEIYQELKLRRAGVDRSPANRKAAEAAAHEIIEPIRRSIASTHIALCVQALTEAADELSEALAEGAVTPESLEAIDKAHDLYVTQRHEAEFKVGA